MSEFKHWCGNCQIRIFIQRHYGKILTWLDCPYVCKYATEMREYATEYATAMRCSTNSQDCGAETGGGKNGTD